MQTQQSSFPTAAMDPSLPRRTYEKEVAPHLSRLNKWVRSKVSQTEDADDVVQDTLLLALRHFDSFRFEANFSTWLCRIALNVIRGRARKPDYHRTVFVDPATLESLAQPTPAASQLVTVERKEASSQLHRAISMLPCEFRMVLELRDLEGFSIRETAEFLSLSKPAVKSRHHRARLRLNTLLETSKGTGATMGTRQSSLKRPGI